MSGDNQLAIKPKALTTDAGCPSLLEVGLGLANSHTTEFSVKRNYKGHQWLFYCSVEELSGKLRGQLRNARKVEAEVTAIKISSLKRVNKGSKIVIIDS
jgi:hypothetical protein